MRKSRIFLWVTFFALLSSGAQATTADSVRAQDSTRLATDSTAPQAQVVEIPKRVLVAKGNSYLENAVTKLLTDSLSTKGVTLHQTSLADLRNESSTAYGAVLVMNAVQSAKLARPVDKFVARAPQPGSNVLIFTVYGQLWSRETASVDATTGSTKDLNIDTITRNILRTLDKIFGDTADSPVE